MKILSGMPTNINWIHSVLCFVIAVTVSAVIVHLELAIRGISIFRLVLVHSFGLGLMRLIESRLLSLQLYSLVDIINESANYTSLRYCD